MFAQWYEDAQRDTQADRECEHGSEHCPDCERVEIEQWHAEHDPDNQR